jgi:hypothetical protein
MVVEAAWCRGGRGGGVGARRGPNAVEEAVGKAPVWTQWQSASRWHGPNGGGGVEAIKERARGWRQNDTANIWV